MANRVHYFIPYMRQGLAAMVSDLSGPGKRITVPVSLHMEASDLPADTVLKDVALLGPGDVLGINERIIRKTEPEADSRTFEPSLIPFVEFTDPDFLWRFSTRKTPDGNNWLPWLSLIVLRSNGGEKTPEFTLLPAAEPELPPRIQLSDDAILPDLHFSWKWAHIHTNDLDNKTIDQLHQSIARTPEQAVCRLLCPRRLEPQTNYSAFIVPTFRIGVDVALGIPSIAERDELNWDTPDDAKGRVIPYYYQWDFQTDTRGDFEYLVRLLQPRVLKDMGTRAIDCSNPGYNLVQGELEMQMEGALRSLDTQYQKWGMDDEDPGTPNETQVAFADLLNSREVTVNGKKKLRVTPPVYGEWYVGGEGGNTQVVVERTSWLEQLNLDFRHRASAGLGVRFVKENQESLMKAAWKQFSEINKVNKSLNLGRFGRAVSMRMYRRLETMADENVLQLSLPLQSKIKSPEQEADQGTTFTLQARLQSSAISNNLSNVKVKKYLSKTNTTQNKSTGYKYAPLLRDQLVSPGFRPDGLLTRGGDTGQIMYKILETGDTQDPAFQQMGLNAKAALNPQTTITSRFTGRIDKLRQWERKYQDKLKGGETRSRALPGATEEDPLRPVMWYPEFHRAMYRFLRDLSQEYILPGMENIPENTVGLLQTNRRFLEAFMIGLNHEFASELRWREFPTDMRGSYFRKFWDTSIYSAEQQEKLLFRNSAIGQELFANIQTQYGSQFDTWEKMEATYTNGDPEVEEQQVAQAYEKAIEDWLLTREEEKDIERPSTWVLDSRLGEHPIQASNKNMADQLVVLVRGDLLRKFGNTLIYLVGKDGSAPPDPDYDPASPRLFPVFEGALSPDITFLGFSIGAAAAGDYFIVFEERMTDLRYGLDETDVIDPAELQNMTLDNLSWQHFENLEAGDYLDGRIPLIEGANWNKPAFIAKAFLQNQVRVAIELSVLIPAESQS
ncbi:MAG: hypothetical protein R2824_19705 [Saprospiraceae bacterium]|nr:hypothetical protein [Lewinella sp.]